MMNDEHKCPNCGTVLSQDELGTVPLLCAECGWAVVLWLYPNDLSDNLDPMIGNPDIGNEKEE